MTIVIDVQKNITIRLTLVLPSPPPTPPDGLLAEDGVTFLVAEDGTTFLVQE